MLRSTADIYDDGDDDDDQRNWSFKMFSNTQAPK